MNTKRTLPSILLLTAALLLAGCGGEPSVTSTPELPTSAATLLATDVATTEPNALPTTEATQFSVFPTLDVPVYPTIVETPFPTPDPAAAPVPTEEVLPAPSGFDRIVLIRTGGPQFEDGTTADEVIALNRQDNAITRGAGTGTLSPAAIATIGGLVDASNFFTVEATFLGAVPAEPPLPFLYSITVTIADYERTINAQEGFMSPEIQALVGAVLVEGQRVPKP